MLLKRSPTTLPWSRALLVLDPEVTITGVGTRTSSGTTRDIEGVVRRRAVLPLLMHAPSTCCLLHARWEWNELPYSLVFSLQRAVTKIRTSRMTPIKSTLSQKLPVKIRP
jgi:hypothetical protein